MSRSVIYQVDCPSCGKKSDFEAWASVNAQMNPELKKKLLNNELFIFRCPECGEVTSVNYPCLYNDVEKRVMIQYCYPDSIAETIESLEKAGDYFEEMEPGFAEESRYEYRIVTDLNDMKEKILILDDELDDHVIELVKTKIKKQLSNEEPIDKVVYSGKGNGDFIVVSGSKVIGNVDFIKELYDGFSELYEKIRDLDDEKYCINEIWAMELIGKVLEE